MGYLSPLGESGFAHGISMCTFVLVSGRLGVLLRIEFKGSEGRAMPTACNKVLV